MGAWKKQIMEEERKEKQHYELHEPIVCQVCGGTGRGNDGNTNMEIECQECYGYGYYFLDEVG